MNNDLNYLRMALEQAMKSPDPSTQNGAILVSSNGQIVGDCNRFPDKVVYKPERWERPLKYSYIEHAERNAVFAAAFNGIKTHGGTLYCPFFACADCARAIIQAGIKRVVGLKEIETATHPRWKETVEIGDTMFTEAGVQFERTEARFDIKLLRNEKLTVF